MVKSSRDVQLDLAVLTFGLGVAAAPFLFVVSVLIHAWIGVRNIFMDYVKHTGVRLVLFVLVILALVAYGFWAVQILWG